MIKVVVGDITHYRGDVIVNAASSGLLGGGGVDGAIHAAAGPDLLQQCYKIMEDRDWVDMPIGDVVVASGCNLDVNYILLTVGPVWHGGECGEIEDLVSCYRNCLNVAKQLGANSIAFPSISTGAYGVPVSAVATRIWQVLKTEGTGLDITLVFYSTWDSDEFLGEVDPSREEISEILRF